MVALSLDGYVDAVLKHFNEFYGTCLDPDDLLCEALNALPSDMPDDVYLMVCERVSEVLWW